MDPQTSYWTGILLILLFFIGYCLLLILFQYLNRMHKNRICEESPPPHQVQQTDSDDCDAGELDEIVSAAKNKGEVERDSQKLRDRRRQKDIQAVISGLDTREKTMVLDVEGIPLADIPAEVLEQYKELKESDPTARIVQDSAGEYLVYRPGLHTGGGPGIDGKVEL